MSRFPIRAGTIICDHQGRPVVLVKRDLHRGAPLQCDDFQFADGHKPVRGELLPRAVSDLLA
jgi:hypothetical protein